MPEIDPGQPQPPKSMPKSLELWRLRRDAEGGRAALIASIQATEDAVPAAIEERKVKGLRELQTRLGAQLGIVDPTDVARLADLLRRMGRGQRGKKLIDALSELARSWEAKSRQPDMSQSLIRERPV